MESADILYCILSRPCLLSDASESRLKYLCDKWELRPVTCDVDCLYTGVRLQHVAIVGPDEDHALFPIQHRERRITMKRQPSRAPSPTPTAFSGISNYRTDPSYRPRDLKGAPAVPTIDYRQVSKTHYGELGRYLANYLASGAYCFFSLWWRILSCSLSSSKFTLKCEIKAHKTDHPTISRVIYGRLRWARPKKEREEGPSLSVQFLTCLSFSFSSFPSRSRGIPSQTQPSASKISDSAHHSVWGPFQRRLLWASTAVSRVQGRRASTLPVDLAQF